MDRDSDRYLACVCCSAILAQLTLLVAGFVIGKLPFVEHSTGLLFIFGGG